MANKIETKAYPTNAVAEMIRTGQLTAENLRQLAFSPDGEKVYVKASALIEGDSAIEREGMPGYRFIASLQSDGQKLVLEAEQGIGELIGNGSTLVRSNLHTVFGALQQMVMKSASGHAKAGKVGDVFLELPAVHERIETWVGTSEQLTRLSTGREGELRNVRLVGGLGALATKDHRLLFAPADEKGRITPASPWIPKFDFAEELRFLSRVDLEQGALVATRTDGRYQAVDIRAILVTGERTAQVAVGTEYEGDGALYVGFTAGKRAFVATIGRTHDGSKRLSVFPMGTGADRRRMPAGAQASLAQIGQA